MRSAITAALALCLISGTALATDYRSEFDKKVKATQNIGALGDDLAGDQLNFFNGAASFSATDISLPGNNGLSVSLGRTLTAEYDPTYGLFGDWEIDLPYISTTMTEAGGWVIDSTTPTNRCSVMGQVKANGAAADGRPPSAMVDEEGGPRHHGFLPEQYWHGYTLHLPSGNQSLLLANVTTTQRPPGTFHWTTNKDWWISCLPSTANGVAGESFFARAPDGTKYTFNWMAGRTVAEASATETLDDHGGPQSYDFVLFRTEYRMYPTLIEDRFGNSVEYFWSGGALQRITASDGRSITLSYTNGRISSASDGSRVWTYTYSGNSLATVTLPDYSAWQYRLDALGHVNRPVPYCLDPNAQVETWDCYGGGLIAENDPITGYVIHPSGARVDFTFKWHFQFSYSASFQGYFPLTLVEKTVSGPGLTPATWKYGFSPSQAEASAACRAGSCPVHVITDELRPDNSVVRRIFGQVRNVDEGLLLGELRGHMSTAAPSAGTAPLPCSPRWGCDILDDPSPLSGTVPAFYQESESRYMPASTSDYTVRVGSNPLSGAWGDTFSSERRLPVQERILRQQGVTFSRATTAYNVYAQPVAVTMGNTGSAGGGASRSENTTYFHHVGKWVIGQVETLTDPVTTKQISRTDYDPITALPIRNYRFGLLQETLTYNADGTVATVKDALNPATSVSSWYRGVPRSIVFPDGSDVAATVNPIGTLASTTDAFDKATTYEYDVLGRLKKMIYPTQVGSPWNDMLRSFQPVAVSEYGLGAGHWKQTTSTGTGKTTTYYDAQWHPVLTVTEDTANPNSRSFVLKKYDAMGREISRSYPVASLTSIGVTLPGIATTYDALGRTYQVKQSSELGLLTTTTEYLTGFKTRTTNPRDFQTTTSYQVFDSPDTSRPVLIQAPEGVTTTIVRDTFGKPLEVTRAGG